MDFSWKAYIYIVQIMQVSGTGSMSITIGSIREPYSFQPHRT